MITTMAIVIALEMVAILMMITIMVILIVMTILNKRPTRAKLHSYSYLS